MLLLIVKSLEGQFEVELKLSQVILLKMETEVRHTNPYSQELDTMINQNGLRVLNPEEENDELKSCLQTIVANQIDILGRYCRN